MRTVSIIPFVFLGLSLSATLSAAPPAETEEEAKTDLPKAAVTSIAPEELADFEAYPPKVQELVRQALALTRQNLTYRFGSSDPKLGGMDCSGTIYHLLQGLGVRDVPRQSDQICGWVRQSAALHRTLHVDSLAHAEFADLKPGDLLFWSSTYSTGPREIPVSHVMLYLGKMKATGKPVVFGASDGRSYEGQRRTGVSVFDFALPKPESKAQFYGYGMVPGIGGSGPSPDEHVIASKAIMRAGTQIVAKTAPVEEIRRAELATVEPPRQN